MSPTLSELAVLHKVLLEAKDNGTRMAQDNGKAIKNGHVKLTKRALDFRRIKIKEIFDDCRWKIGLVVHNNGSKYFNL